MGWTILEEFNRAGKRYARARCSCGREHEVSVYTIRTGASTRCKSCRTRAVHTKHGGHGTAEYTTWEGINRRGMNRDKRNAHYAHVEVAAEWRGSDGFVQFLAHIGKKPSPKHTIDRVDNAKGYIPGNVRWATMREQAQNRRDNVLLTHGGTTLCLTEWARRAKLHPMTVRNRLNAGWSVERALTAPPRRRAQSQHRRQSHPRASR